MRRIWLLLVGVLTGASALVTGYHVEPKTAAMSGKASGDPQTGGVSEVITINFDELDSTAGAYCEFFAGSKSGGGQYNLSVLTYPGGTPIAPDAHANGNVDHEWVRFKIGVSYPESIIKGKQLEFKFTRGGGDSIQYYFDGACGYNYGRMIAPYPPPSLTTGLAMRVMGRMNAVDSLRVGMGAPVPTPVLAQSA